MFVLLPPLAKSAAMFAAVFAAAAAFGVDPSVSQEIVVNIEVNVGLLGFSGEGAWQFELNAGELHSLLERMDASRIDCERLEPGRLEACVRVVEVKRKRLHAGAA